MEVTRIPKKTVSLLEPKKPSSAEHSKYLKKRVAAYCRVSTDSEEQLTSYETQKRVYSEMILSNKEWSLAGIYADEGISGTRADKRTEFKKMIDDCLEGKIDYVITKSVSRFSRNTVDCLDYVRMLKSRGIGILFEEQNIDTLKCDSELYLVIYAGFAQSESESMSKNITWAFRKKFEEGKVSFNYSRFVGYRKGADGSPEIIPEEAEIIRNIFDMFLSGMTPKIISDRLLADGVQSKCGKQKWSVSTIQRILRNEKYCGDAILQKTVTVDCISKTVKKNTGEAPMYYVRNSHAAIISRDVFNRVQEELARRSSLSPLSIKTSYTAKGKYSKNALSNLVYCEECGTKYRRVTWANKYGKKIVWRCVNRIENGTKYCKHSPSIAEEELKRAVVQKINELCQNSPNKYIELLNTTLYDAIGLNEGRAEIDLLTAQIEAINQRIIDMMNDSAENGEELFENDRENEFAELSGEAQQLSRRIEAIKDSAIKSHEAAARVKELQDEIMKYHGGITEYDDSIVRSLIERVIICQKGTIEVIIKSE